MPEEAVERLIEKRNGLSKRLATLEATLSGLRTKREQAAEGLREMGVKVDEVDDFLALAAKELEGIETETGELEAGAEKMTKVLARLEA